MERRRILLCVIAAVLTAAAGISASVAGGEEEGETVVIALARDGKAPPPPTATPTLTPTPTPTPVRAYGTLTRAEVRAVLIEVGWPQSQIPHALYVARCESTYNTYAVNPSSGTLGLFQIHPDYHIWRFRGRDWANAYANADVALEIWHEFGWGPWVC